VCIHVVCIGQRRGPVQRARSRDWHTSRWASVWDARHSFLNGGQSGRRLPQALCGQQLGIRAVVLNVLIDKGVITQDELRARFEQAQGAAADSSGGSVAAEALTAIVSYLEPTFRIREV
jgi:hypothetical protein